MPSGQFKYDFCEDPSDFDSCLLRIDLPIVGVDTETTGLDPTRDGVQLRIVTIGVQDYAVVFDIFKLDERCKERLRYFLDDTNRKKIFHNAKFDMKFLISGLGCSLEEKVFCTFLASQLVAGGNKFLSHSLQTLVQKYFNVTLSKEQRLTDWSKDILDQAQIEYAANDIKYLIPLREILFAKLKELELLKVASIEFNALAAVCEKELTGFKMNVPLWKRTADRNHARMIRMQSKISRYIEPGVQTLFDAPVFKVTDDQLKKRLTEKGIKVPTIIDKKTGKEKQTLELQTLEKHKNEDPIFPMIIKHSSLKKGYTSYGYNWFEKMNPRDERVHEDYKQIGTETGRISCVTGDTMIECPRDLKKDPLGIPIKNIKPGQYIYTFDKSMKLCLKKVKAVWKVGEKETVKLTIQGYYQSNHPEKKTYSIEITPDHMLRIHNGIWRQVCELNIGDRFLSMPRRKPLYENIYQHFGAGSVKSGLVRGDNNKLSEHRFIYNELHSCNIPDGYVVHHKDGNHLNNSIDNLELKQLSIHVSEHRKKVLKEDVENCVIDPSTWKFNPKAFQRLYRHFGINIDRSRYKEIMKYLWSHYVKNHSSDQEFAYIDNSAKKIPIREGSFYEVVSIEPNGIKEVWDMEVEETHTFIGCGIAMHNCGLHTIPQEYIYRRCFIAGEGNVLVWADYSQAELRILAELSQDPQMMKAFLDGKDLHTATAALLFETPYEQVTSSQRKRAKNLNFGIVYGIGPKKFSDNAEISYDEALEIIKNYFKAYPGVRDWLNDAEQNAIYMKQARTLSGRLALFEFDEKQGDQRAMVGRNGKNFPIQALSADITKLALGYLKRTLKGRAKIVHSMHDEIILESPKEFQIECQEILKSEMMRAGYEFMKTVPMIVEVQCHHHWRKEPNKWAKIIQESLRERSAA